MIIILRIKMTIIKEVNVFLKKELILKGRHMWCQ